MSPNGAEAKAAAGKEANWIYTPPGFDFLGSGSIAQRKLCSTRLGSCQSSNRPTEEANVRFWPKAYMHSISARAHRRPQQPLAREAWLYNRSSNRSCAVRPSIRKH